MSNVTDFLPYLKRKLMRELILICSDVMTDWIEESDMPRQLKNLHNHFDQLDLRALKNLISDPEGLQNFINIQFTSGQPCIACSSYSSRGICKVWQASRSLWSSCKKFDKREDDESKDPEPPSYA